ncbi:MAG TPA: GAF and ANTAR domain-containing protein [Acidimicrobiales bacterium]|nr:GAF and ANTAR domain-containing protein [Acidimicrobiales bacterium]
MREDLSSDEQPLQAGLRGLAEMLLTEDHDAVLASVTSLAAAALPGCDAASVSLIERGRPATPVCSAELAKRVDQSQYDNHEGPCLCAIESNQVVRVDSFRRDDRWPAFAKEAVEQGILSSLSFPLHAGGELLGALNLYSSGEDAFVDAENEGAAFARQASVTLTNAVALRRAQSLAQQLAVALENRDIIGQAKGIIMAAEGRSSDEAFDVLRRASQRSNRKLHDVAEEIVARRQRPRASSGQA